MFQIQLLSREDEQEWDEYVRMHADSSPYHLIAWKKAVKSAYGHEGFYFTAKEDGRVVGVLPLVHIKLPFLVNELVGLPYCDVGQCLADSIEIQSGLVAHARDYCADFRAQMKLRGTEGVPEGLQDFFFIENLDKVRMFLRLPASSDELFAGFRSKLRSQVRKSEKNGVMFRWGGIGDIDDIYHVFSKNMHRLGSPVHSKKLIRAVLEEYGQRARAGLVEYNGEVIGTGIVLTTDRMVSIPWASTLGEYNRLAPNMLLYWNLLKFSCDKGFSVFDFGRSTEGEGTYLFKKQWGAKPRPLTWLTSDSRSVSGAADREKETSRGKLARGWSSLPFKVATMLGPLIRGYISR